MQAFYFFKLIEYVQFGYGQLIHAVDAGSVFQGNQVNPAATSGVDSGVVAPNSSPIFADFPRQVLRGVR